MSITCRHCGLINPDAADNCDCGWIFAQHRLGPARRDARGKSGARDPRLGGTILVLLGTVWLGAIHWNHQALSAGPFVVMLVGVHTIWRGFERRRPKT